METLTGVIAVGLFSALSFWMMQMGSVKTAGVIFILTGGIAGAAGFQWYDAYVNPFGLTISIMIFAYGLVCFSMAFRCILTKPSGKDGD